LKPDDQIALYGDIRVAPGIAFYSHRNVLLYDAAESNLEFGSTTRMRRSVSSAMRISANSGKAAGACFWSCRMCIGRMLVSGFLEIPCGFSRKPEGNRVCESAAETGKPPIASLDGKFKLETRP